MSNQRFRRVVAACALLAVLPASAAGAASRPARLAPAGRVSGAAVGTAYEAPVRPMRVRRAFAAPATAYGPGHRGVDLAARAGAAVGAAASGVVAFAGRVAGRGVVVVAHPDGVRTEYEPLRPTVVTGQRVAAGQVIGVLEGAHPGCEETACLHWGARRGPTYLDPLLLLRPLAPVRLLPWAIAGPVPPPGTGRAPALTAAGGPRPFGQARGWARSKVCRSRSIETWV